MRACSSSFERENAKRYDKWYESPEGRQADKLEKDLFLKVVNPKKGETLLDIGCGTGHFSFWFHDLGLKVTGIDISLNMLGVAVDRLKHEEIKLVRGDAHSLPFQDKSFDLTVMITTLEFLREPRKAVEEAFRVSKSKVFLGVLSRWSILSLRRRLKTLFRGSIYQKAKFYSIRELTRLIENYLPPEAKILSQKTLRGAFIGLVADLG
ncbi:methyltransferase domain-containing protein [Candidatus Aerophobetes bacterium]|uniref:Methyltransferase domain-containing protein n=1 Tax=Aerophobetes bacterium TaxID=2030807 RepID=A0A523WCE3_UNCAE|nr:MAG: methyltransferase domain-containing protein [Candidatus Aerophobetes bacterium]